MNPLTHFKKTQILSLLIAPALAVAALTPVPVRATPACGVSTVIMALEHYPSGSLDLMCNEFRQFRWFLRLDVHGDSDVDIGQNTFQPGVILGGTRIRVPAWSPSRQARLRHTRHPTPPAHPTFIIRATASPI